MATNGAIEDGTLTFSSTVGLLYVFNLIVGTGALALPRAFQTAGYVLGLVLLLISAVSSYICSTFVIESLAVANFVLKYKNAQKATRLATSTAPSLSSSTNNPAINHDHSSNVDSTYFKISQRVELTEMAHIFLGRFGVVFTYFSLSVYLFGDLTIYSTTVPKSMMNIICASPNSSENLTDGSLPCRRHLSLPYFATRFFVYRACVLLFAALCLLMVLIGMTRTKYVQLGTTISRWTAFVLMIALAGAQLAAKGAQTAPPAANFRGFGSFFGVAVYAFMCHHSIPGLVAPMRNTSFISYRIGLVYSLIFIFYCTLSLTGSFAFETVQDVYTLNFFHDDQTGNVFYFLVDYFLALFPVFTLTSSYVIVAITLSNNMRVLLRMLTEFLRDDAVVLADETRRINFNVGNDERQRPADDENEALLNEEDNYVESGHNLPTNSTDERLISPAASSLNEAGGYRSTASLLMLPAFVIGLPTLLSLFTDNVLFLASITGSYPGVGVQFVIPSVLVLGARAYLWRLFVSSADSHSFDVSPSSNLPSDAEAFLTDFNGKVPFEHASPFRYWLWPYVTLVWAAFCLIIVSLNILHLG